MLFGRSLFGGALVAGLVTLAGAAVCTASASGDATVLYKGRGAAQATAHVAVADALRSAIGGGHVALCEAQLAAAPSASFFVEGDARVSALAEGIAQAQFFGEGVAQGDAYAQARIFRRVRMRYQPPAHATATGQGEVVSHLLAYGKRALARAKLFGTTYHVGRGVAAASAKLQGDAQKAIGARQYALAEASAAATIVHTVGCAGDGEATAVAEGHPAITTGGVRYFDLAGAAHAEAYAPPAQMLVFQPQSMVAGATASGWAIQTRGFSGHGVATAKASGYMDMTYTGQVGAPASVTATATAYAVRHVRLGAAGVATAEGFAQARGDFFGGGVAQMGAQLDAAELHFRLRPQPARGVAAALALAQRVIVADSTVAECVAQATGYNQINDLAPAPERRTLRVLHEARTMAIPFENRTVRV